jgi:hypothetical protein
MFEEVLNLKQKKQLNLNEKITWWSEEGQKWVCHFE